MHFSPQLYILTAFQALDCSNPTRKLWDESFLVCGIDWLRAWNQWIDFFFFWGGWGTERKAKWYTFGLYCVYAENIKWCSVLFTYKLTDSDSFAAHCVMHMLFISLVLKWENVRLVSFVFEIMFGDFQPIELSYKVLTFLPKCHMMMTSRKEREIKWP